MPMAEVLIQFGDPVVSRARKRYRAQACGAPMGGALWEAWIEFTPLGGGASVRSPRETTQPNRTDTVYWATGLSAVFLEGALERALSLLVPKPAPPEAARPRFDGSADTVVTGAKAPLATEAVLDPFSVYASGETLLRQRLGALAPWHLVNIILAYGLSDESEALLNRTAAPMLIDVIVAGVRKHTMAR
jgi:hypothetical protein